MIAALLAAELALVVLVLVEGWVDLAPFNHLGPAGRRSIRRRLARTAGQLWPVAGATALTAGQLVSEPSPFLAAIAAGLLAFAAAATVTGWWIPWWFGASQTLRAEYALAARSHSILEPRKRGGVVPSTLLLFVHAQVWLALVLSVMVLLAGGEAP